MRKLLQEDITQVRYDEDEEIWLRVLQNLIQALDEIVCVKTDRLAITDLRFLTEMKGIKELGGAAHARASTSSRSTPSPTPPSPAPSARPATPPGGAAT